MLCLSRSLRAVILFLFMIAPSAVALADQAAEDFMKETWRRYKTAPALVVIVSTRGFNEQGGTVDLRRYVIFCSERGYLRISSPTNTWVFRSGQVFGDSKYFPGSYIVEVIGANAGEALKSMEAMWPITELPVEARLRMAVSWQEAFKKFHDHVGSDAEITVEDGTWPGDDAPARIIRFRSADSASRATVWIDSESRLLRAWMLEDASGHVSSVSEPELRNRLGQDIGFGTAGRTKYTDFKSLSEDFNTRYSMPKATEPAPPAKDG